MTHKPVTEPGASSGDAPAEDGRDPAVYPGPRYARARELAGLSLRQAARLLGWAPEPLEAIESGAWHLLSEDDQRRMCDVYGCSIEWIRGDQIDPPADLVRALRDKGVEGHDRDVVLEFSAMIQGRPPAKTLADIRAGLVESEPDPRAAVPVERKRRYARSQKQTRKHHCHWPGCTEQVPPAMWGCKAHWFKLPKVLRDRIWRTYAPGQEVDMTPSEEYLQVADDVQRWIAMQPKTDAEAKQLRENANWRAVKRNA